MQNEFSDKLNFLSEIYILIIHPQGLNVYNGEESIVPNVFMSLTYLLPTLPDLAHGAATKLLQPSLYISLATFSMVLKLALSLLNSLSTILHHVFFGHPFLHFPSDHVHHIAIVATLLSFWKTCPNHLHLLLVVIIRISSCLACLKSQSLEVFRARRFLETDQLPSQEGCWSIVLGLLFKWLVSFLLCGPVSLVALWFIAMKIN